MIVSLDSSKVNFKYKFYFSYVSNSSLLLSNFLLLILNLLYHCLSTEPAIQFIVAGLGDKDLVFISADALKLIYRKCSQHMVENFDSGMRLLQSIDSAATHSAVVQYAATYSDVVRYFIEGFTHKIYSLSVLFSVCQSCTWCYWLRVWD